MRTKVTLPKQSGAEPQIDRFRKQHLDVARREIETPHGAKSVTVDGSESPLGWLARRKGRDGRPLIEPVQLLAGERLRAEFTRAQMMPRTTSNWTAAVSDGARGASPGNFTDAMIGTRQRVRNALDAVGPEFSGLLVDVCCFLKSIAEIESERGWPARSGKVVLQLGLDRLARHYGLVTHVRGKSRAEVRTWLAPGEEFRVDLETG